MVEHDDDDALLFADDDEQLATSEGATPHADDPPWRVLVIDDEPEVHAITRLALADLRIEGRGIELLSAYTGAEARTRLEGNDEVALVLLDVVMESEHAGLALARWIREERRDHLIRIVLRTGQPGTAPEQQVMLEYDINDYRAKYKQPSSDRPLRADRPQSHEIGRSGEGPSRRERTERDEVRQLWATAGQQRSPGRGTLGIAKPTAAQ